MARKILLADDSVTAQNMGRRILSEAGYEVIGVNNGSAALKKVAEMKPDLVILDVYMPGYGGLEVCQRIKGSPETFHIPVLLTVGKLEPFKAEEARRVGADAHLVKPFEASELLTALSKLEDKIVPQAEPAAPPAVKSAAPPRRVAVEPPPAEAASSAAKEPKFGDSMSGWKNRLAIPSSTPKSEEPRVEAPRAAATAFRNFARPDHAGTDSLEKGRPEKDRSEKDRLEKDGLEAAHTALSSHPTLDAASSAGLVQDVTAEEIAAITAAAAAAYDYKAEPSASAEEAATPEFTPDFTVAQQPSEAAPDIAAQIEAYHREMSEPVAPPVWEFASPFSPVFEPPQSAEAPEIAAEISAPSSSEPVAAPEPVETVSVPDPVVAESAAAELLRSESMAAESSITESTITESTVAESTIAESMTAEVTNTESTMAEPGLEVFSAAAPAVAEAQPLEVQSFERFAVADSTPDADVVAALESLTPASGNGATSHGEQQHAVDVPAAFSGPRWIAEEVAVQAEDVAAILEQEMQKTRAAMAELSGETATEAPHSVEIQESSSAPRSSWDEARPEIGAESASLAVEEPVADAVAVAISEPQSIATVDEPAASAPAAIAEPEAAAVAKTPADVVAVEPAQSYGSSDSTVSAELVTELARAEAPGNEAAPAQEYSEPVAAVSESVIEAPAIEAPANEAPTEDVAFATAAAGADSSFASILSTVDAVCSAAAAAPAESAPANGNAPAPPANGEREAELAAAWAHWRQIRETVAGPQFTSQLADAAAAEFKDIRRKDIQRASSNASSEPEPQAAAAAAATSSAADSADIASIVDSVLSQLRPKLVEEIAKKLGEKK